MNKEITCPQCGCILNPSYSKPYKVTQTPSKKFWVEDANGHTIGLFQGQDKQVRAQLVCDALNAYEEAKNKQKQN